MIRIFRIQDADGRGPYKPGFSHRWVDQRADDTHRPPYFVEFPHISRLLLPGWHYGCGFRTARQLHRWFSQAEVGRLKKLGYDVVLLDVDRIIAESDNQLVFACVEPLRFRVRPAKEADHD